MALMPPRAATSFIASPIGLTSTLDIAEPGQLIMIVSYGSGSGSDGFIFRTTDLLTEVQDKARKTTDYLDKNQHYLDYGTYAKYRRKILR